MADNQRSAVVVDAKPVDPAMFYLTGNLAELLPEQAQTGGVTSFGRFPLNHMHCALDMCA